jgi:citrate synthase
MEMLDDIGFEEEVEEYIDGLLGEQKKIMGFGHRVYKVEDPRTKHLRGIVEDFCHRERTLGLYNKCVKIEEIVYERKKIYPNVDFYAAVAMDALGVPKEFFPLFFASSRISGWVAHVLEQYRRRGSSSPCIKIRWRIRKTFCCHRTTINAIQQLSYYKKKWKK